MKTTCCILLCCSCLASCHSHAQNKEMKSDLNLSLLFYPSMSIEDIRYSLDIINDSLIVKRYDNIDNKEHRGKLTDNQCTEIKKMTSALTQKFSRLDIFAKGGLGCTLKIDNQVFYEDNFFSFQRTLSEIQVFEDYSISYKIPEEIKSLIDYIVNLSPIPIDLYWF